MFEVLTSALTIRPADSQDLSDAYCNIRQIIRKQVEAFIDRFGGDVPIDWQSTTSWEAPDRGAYFKWNEWDGQLRSNVALADIHLGWHSRGNEWKTDVRLGMTEGSILLTAAWRCSADHHATFPFTSVPPMLAALASEVVCSLSLDVSFAPHQVDQDNVEDFYRYIVANPARRIPILLISPENNTQRIPVDVDEVARRLFGLAHVYWFKDENTERSFAALPKAQTCRNGAGRLYWPFINRDTKHPVIPLLVRKTEVMESLFRTIAGESPRWFEPPEALFRLEQLQRQDEQRQRQQVIDDLSRTEADVKGWEQIFQAQEDKIRQLEAEKTNLKEENTQLAQSRAKLRVELQTAHDNLAAVWGQRFSELELESDLPSPQDVQYGLYLSSHARASLASAPSNQHREFLQELRKLVEKPDLRQRNTKTVAQDCTDCCIFPQGDRSIRIMYYECPDRSIRVCELVDHDEYERLLNRRCVFRSKYSDEEFEWFALLPVAPVAAIWDPGAHSQSASLVQ